MTTGALATLVVAVSLLGLGAYLLLPHRLGRIKTWRMHLSGAVLAAAGVVAFASLWAAPFPEPSGPAAASQWLTRVFFYGLGTVTLSAAVMLVISRNPVHNALWFALVLLAVSGLFLLVDAQFLAAGTVIVYAGAIVVTFLFVIMLAQSEGYAVYDRMARAPLISTLSACLVLGLIGYAACLVREASTPTASSAAQDMEQVAVERRLVPLSDLAERAGEARDPGARRVLERWEHRGGVREVDGRGRPWPHVAELGQALFTDHLIAVEAAGAILFVALVGAAAIAAPRSAANGGA